MKNRIGALERQVVTALKPTEREYRVAFEREGARLGRRVRQWAEQDLLQRAGGIPFEFNDELGEVIGSPDLWRSSAIAKEDILLEGDNPEQEARDHDTCRRWHLAVSGYDLDAVRSLPLSASGEANLSRECLIVARRLGVDIEDVLARARELQEADSRFEGWLANKVQERAGEQG